MKNYVQPGDVITIPAPEDVTGGKGVLVGSLFGIAAHDAASGSPVPVSRKGVFKMNKTSAQAWSVGAKIYWDGTAKECTTTATGNKLVGLATADAANPSEYGMVSLDGAAR